MNQQMRAWLHAFWAFIFLFVGLALFFVAEYFRLNVPASVFNVLNGLAGSLTVAGVLGIIEKYFLHNQLVEFVINKVSLKKSLDSTGVSDIQLGWRNLPYNKLFSNTKYHIDIVHAYGSTWTNSFTDDLVDMLNKGVTIRVFLLDPDNEALMKVFANQYDSTGEELSRRVNGVIKKWKIIRDRVEPSKQDLLELYLNDGVQTIALYRFDDTIIASALSLVKGQKIAYRLPSLICEKDSQTDNLYSAYDQEINHLSKQAKRVNFDTIN